MGAQLYSHWVFDLDGTLTRPIFDFPAIKKRLGLPLDRGILEVLQELPPERAQHIAVELEAIEYELAGKAQAADGALALLDGLRARNVQLGILTRNLKSHAWHTLEVTGMAAFFRPDYIIGREEAAHKPSPEGVNRLLNTWGARPEQAVMVGDYLFDLQAGKAAGTTAIYVDPSGAFVHRAFADFSFSSLTDLHAAFVI